MYLLYKRHQKRKQARLNQHQALSSPSQPSYPSAEKEEGATTIIHDAEPATSPVTKTKTREGQAAKSAARKYRWRLMFGLLLPYFIASTDITIVATAVPFIASHFGRLDQLNWIVTAFTITSTSFIPVWGQMSDIFGRHAILQTVMVIMMVGAALCAGAQAWAMLLFGRALMGVAAAGILNIVKIVLADGVSLEENAKNNTTFAMVGGISFGIGPVIGGYLTSVSWRWCFILNIPVALLAMLGLWVLLRKDLVAAIPAGDGMGRRERFLERLKTIDCGGLVLFVTSVTLIILGTTWGGATYPWRSAAVIIPIVLGGCIFVLFFLYEYLMEPGRLLSRIIPDQKPMVPMQLFQKRDMSLLAWISFSTGSAMYSIFYFVGIYFIIAKGYEAGDAGKSLLYYLPGIGVGAYLAMFMSNVWPKQTWSAIFTGSVLETVGFGVLIFALHSGRVAVIGGMMGLTGAGNALTFIPVILQHKLIQFNIGTGLRLMPETLHVAGIWPSQIASAMSVIDFCIPFGGTISLAMMGAVFNNKLVGHLPASTDQSQTIHVNPHNQGILDQINALPHDIREAFRDRARQAVMFAFAAVMPIIGLAVVASLCLGNVKITKGAKKTSAGHLETSDAVERRPYLLAVISDRRGAGASPSVEGGEEDQRKA